MCVCVMYLCSVFLPPAGGCFQFYPMFLIFSPSLPSSSVFFSSFSFVFMFFIKKDDQVRGVTAAGDRGGREGQASRG